MGGGLGSKEDNLFKFKRVFNKSSTTVFSIGRKIYNKESYDFLSELNESTCNRIKDENFFPKYRG